MSNADSPASRQKIAPGPTGRTDNAPPTNQTILHASCVSVRGCGALILGASGRGKSSLALDMLAMGATLVADDRVCLTRKDQKIIASPPPALAGLIEARGIGLLHATPGDPVPLACVVDLDQVETSRMPPHRHTQLLGQTIALLFRVETPHFSSALVQYLKAGRHEA